MGFLSAFDVAARSVATGSGPVAIVASEMGSRYITPEDPRPFLVCADAAAAAILAPARDGDGVLGAWLRNDGTIRGEVGLDHPGLTGRRETIRFGAPNAAFSEIAVRVARRAVDAVVEEAGVALDAIEWIVPHQPNGSLLASILEALALDPGRVVPIVHDVGSVGAASIPIGLDRLLRTRPVRAGDRILMLGIGAGAAYGAILYQVGG
jgi:3-oxoacyl-[acyl-carrier-protein] synthase III